MSHANAALSLPPGDRDEAVPPPERIGPAIAGREPEAAARQPLDLTPELVRLLATSIDDAAAALGFLRTHLAAGDVASAAADAWRLNEALTIVDLRALSIDLRRQIIAAQRMRGRQPAETRP